MREEREKPFKYTPPHDLDDLERMMVRKLTIIGAAEAGGKCCFAISLDSVLRGAVLPGFYQKVNSEGMDFGLFLEQSDEIIAGAVGDSPPWKSSSAKLVTAISTVYGNWEMLKLPKSPSPETLHRLAETPRLFKMRPTGRRELRASTQRILMEMGSEIASSDKATRKLLGVVNVYPSGWGHATSISAGHLDTREKVFILCDARAPDLFKQITAKETEERMIETWRNGAILLLSLIRSSV